MKKDTDTDINNLPNETIILQSMITSFRKEADRFTARDVLLTAQIEELLVKN